MVVAGDDLLTIATALAADINDNALDTLIVQVEGSSTLVITDRAGEAFDTAAWIALATDSLGTITEEPVSAATVATPGYFISR